VIDEFNPADSTQAIYMSENLMKVLLSPQVPGSVRCRNDDKMLPIGLPRIFTGNAESVEEWCGYRCRWSEPLQRKAIVFNITQPLCKESWRKPEDGNNEHNENAVEVARVLSETHGNLFVDAPAPPSLAGRLTSALRSMFGSGAASSSSSSNP